MKLLVGLGNPGPRYAGTRHNVGFEVLRCVAARAGIALANDRFSSRCGAGIVSGEAALLLLPQTFMNRSGEAVAAALEAHPEIAPERDLLVVFDDLDLPLGRIRLRPAGGAGGHNGLADVLECLESRAVPRLRFGIGRPPAGQEPIGFVLGRFESEEAEEFDAAIARAAEAAECFAQEGAEVAMNHFNRA